MKVKDKIRYLLLLIVLVISCKKDVKQEEGQVDHGREQGLISLSGEFLWWGETTKLTFDIAKGNKELVGYTKDLYLHAGLILASSKSEKDWYQVVTDWNENRDTYKLTPEKGGFYSIEIKPSDFFGRAQGEDVTHIAFLVRNSDGSRVLRNTDGSDIYYPVSLKQKPDIRFISPALQPTFIPQLEKTTYEIREEIDIYIEGSQTGALTLYQNGKQLVKREGKNLTHTLKLEEKGLQVIEGAIESNGYKTTRKFHVFVDGDIEVGALPKGLNSNGLTINRDKQEVSFALTATGKSSVFLLGDFNSYEAHTEYAMKRTEDGNTWWITLTDLNFHKNYTYQYLVDGELKVADPYARLVLDPDHDGGVKSFSGLPSYPTGKTEGIVSVLQLQKDEYVWKSNAFNRPHIDDLVIYELHIRDFLSERNYTTLRDSISYFKRLGVNAVELMPIQEFEGNSSWGYNPSFHFAVDKYYGAANELKAFVDECHQAGIAVIADMVLNHAFGQSPLVRLYQHHSGSVSADNPWFNIIPTHPFNVGHDFNHESLYTQQFTKNVIAYWMEEFKLDGFRFDLSKGFTQRNSGTDGSEVDQWSAYDASRVAIWKNYNNYIRDLDPELYVILEHFADDREERELAEEGMYLWNNLNYVFNEATMGYVQNTDFTRLFAEGHGFQHARFVSYMESHDEERILYKNLKYGNSSGTYSTKEIGTALDRVKQAAAFLFCAPGPKMIWQFGELGYDISIDENGRTGEKPLKWSYLQDEKRKSLFDHYAKLIRWKKNNPVFRDGAVEHSVKGAVKYYIVNRAGQEVALIGNFDVVEHEFPLPDALQTTWFDNIEEKIINWSSVPSIRIAPGQYYIISINKLIT